MNFNMAQANTWRWEKEKVIPPECAAELMEKLLKKDLEKFIVPFLHRIGQEACNWCKQNGNYIDRTGNLRNSIGYAIFKDGRISEKIVQGKDYKPDFITNLGLFFNKNKDSIKSSDELLRSLSDSMPKNGYALVIFAGMEYGIFVEAKGYTVISNCLNQSVTAQALQEALKKYKKE